MTSATPPDLREALARDEAPSYGIIDPDYARVFTIARCIAWSEGYALMMHGSFTRDLDLLAVPWAETVCEPEHLVRRVEDAAGLKLVSAEPGQKPHGRLAWTMLFSGFSDPRFVDFSVLPSSAATARADALERAVTGLERRAEAQEDALLKIEQWSRAYPLSVFPEPDWENARVILDMGGITLDSISASCMRHAVEGVGKIARAVLAQQEKADV